MGFGGNEAEAGLKLAPGSAILEPDSAARSQTPTTQRTSRVTFDQEGHAGGTDTAPAALALDLEEELAAEMYALFHLVKPRRAGGCSACWWEQPMPTMHADLLALLCLTDPYRLLLCSPLHGSPSLAAQIQHAARSLQPESSADAAVARIHTTGSIQKGRGPAAALKDTRGAE